MTATIAALLVLPLASRAAETAAGAPLYDRYCASCHGTTGRGNGPVAPALVPPPSDLTALQDDVAILMQKIDGRRTVRAHGTAEMPVWGEIFEGSLIGEPHRRRTALLRVQSIAEYVRSLRGSGPPPTPRP